MPDPVFAEPRLARIYDDLDPNRGDLDEYAGIVQEFGARSVLDIGCGTGTFACMLAARGIDVTGVDPAAASLDVARGKPGAEAVRWLHGDATSLPPLQVDMVTMTANVAQVFLTDEDWTRNLLGARQALRPGGHLVFETRDPARRAWEEWTREQTLATTKVPGEGLVQTWGDVLDIDEPLVTFRQHFRFLSDGALLTSDSTLRFRGRGELESSLESSGYVVAEVRDAADRPGREFVFIARTP